MFAGLTRTDPKSLKMAIFTYNQSQKFWDNSTKHNLLGFSLKKLKDNSIKTPLPLPYINVVGQ